MVKEVSDVGEFEREIRGPGLVIVDYFATWCGPCRNIAPFVDQLSEKYPHVKFIKVDADKSDISQQRRVSALPTFHFFINGNLVDEMRGADPASLEAKLNQHNVVAVSAFAGKGFSLGGTAETSAQAVLEARLKNFQQHSSSSSGVVKQSAPVDVSSNVYTAAAAAVVGTADLDEEEEIAKAIALSMSPSVSSSSSQISQSSVNPNSMATAAAGVNTGAVESLEAREAREIAEAEAEQKADDDKWGEEMVPVPVDEGLLKELLDMGFPDVRARKGLIHGGMNVEGAINWLSENENDPNIDQPYMVKRSEAVPKRVLTDEEKALQLIEMREKIRKRKDDRAKEEKEAEIRREKERRERGQKLGEVQEERDRMVRKREAEKLKREKMDAEKERERLRAEIARDKEIRRMNRGVLPSVLGVEGYNPSAVQYDQQQQQQGADSVAGGVSTTSAPAVSSASASKSSAGNNKPSGGGSGGSGAARPSASLSVEDQATRIDSAIATLSKYRTANAGADALKLLHLFISNISDNPSELKYRSINTESAAYKSKLAPLVGPSLLLKTLGFKKNEETGKLTLDGELTADQLKLFRDAKAKLSAAESSIRT